MFLFNNPCSVCLAAAEQSIVKRVKAESYDQYKNVEIDAKENESNPLNNECDE